MKMCVNALFVRGISPLLTPTGLGAAGVRWRMPRVHRTGGTTAAITTASVCSNESNTGSSNAGRARRCGSGRLCKYMGSFDHTPFDREQHARHSRVVDVEGGVCSEKSTRWQINGGSHRCTPRLTATAGGLHHRGLLTPGRGTLPVTQQQHRQKQKDQHQHAIPVDGKLLRGSLRGSNRHRKATTKLP